MCDCGLCALCVLIMVLAGFSRCDELLYFTSHVNVGQALAWTALEIGALTDYRDRLPCARS